MKHDEALRLRTAMRIAVLRILLEALAGKTKPVKLHDYEINAKLGILDSNIARCMGDLSKAFPIAVQLADATNMSSLSWIITVPSIAQIAKALEIACTDGNCTSWIPSLPKNLLI